MHLLGRECANCAGLLKENEYLRGRKTRLEEEKNKIISELDSVKSMTFKADSLKRVIASINALRLNIKNNFEHEHTGRELISREIISSVSDMQRVHNVLRPHD